MIDATQFYINGEWVAPLQARPFEVINPATEEVAGRISLGTKADVDRAVLAARARFAEFSQTSLAERIDLFAAIITAYQKREDDLAEAVMIEMGSPLWFAKAVQFDTPLLHFKHMREVLSDYDPSRMMNTTRVVREAIGVCGFITPWNWPLNQIVSKLAGALGAGCTVVVKPSEIAPLSPVILAEVLHDAGVPPGVFNLVNGLGPEVGEAISSHPDIDMVSFTGSTRAGVLVAKSAADSVKKVHQELGGKSANIIVPGTDLEAVIPADVMRAYTNSGQSCQAPTRMLVHKSEREKVYEIAKRTAEGVVLGDPRLDDSRLGPLASEVQFERVQGFIRAGIEEGAKLVAGGEGRPPGIERGYFARPTVFGDVQGDMTIAQQEIFGPVLAIQVYDDEDHAIELANGTDYGLAGYVRAPDLETARAVGARIRAGRIYLNGAPRNHPQDVEAPFGGYKQSGNGREAGLFGLEEFLEIKALIGYEEA